MGKRSKSIAVQSEAQQAEDRLVMHLGNMLSDPNEVAAKLARLAREYRGRMIVAEQRVRELEQRMSAMTEIMNGTST